MKDISGFALDSQNLIHISTMSIRSHHVSATDCQIWNRMVTIWKVSCNSWFRISMADSTFMFIDSKSKLCPCFSYILDAAFGTYKKAGNIIGAACDKFLIYTLFLGCKAGKSVDLFTVRTCSTISARKKTNLWHCQTPLMCRFLLCISTSVSWTFFALEKEKSGGELKISLPMSPADKLFNFFFHNITYDTSKWHEWQIIHFCFS